MASLRSSFGDLLEPGFRKIFDDKYTEIPEVFPRVLHVNTSAKQDEKDSAVTGFGLLVETAEGAAIDYDDPIQMYDKRYVHKKYTRGFKVSEEMYEDDLYNVMNKKPAALAKAARRTAENQASNVLNNAFSTAAADQGGDAKPLCSTTHPRADGGTAQSNASATGITLSSDANFETAVLALRAQLDDRGQKIMARASKLIVPPALEKEAKILINSNLRAGTADNDVNVYKGAVDIEVWDYITTSTYWFLVDQSQHELNWFWRVRPEFKQDTSFDNGYALYKVRTRFSKGFSDWRGVWGSKGDGAAYSS